MAASDTSPAPPYPTLGGGGFTLKSDSLSMRLADDLFDFDSDGEESPRGLKRVTGTAIDKTSFADAGFAEQQEFDSALRLRDMLGRDSHRL